MYGIIHKAVQSFVLQTADAESWQRICEACGFDDEHTLSSVHFDDVHTVALGQAAADELGVSLEDAFYHVGVHWTEFAKREGYGALFSMAGDTLPEFLSNLDRMHASLKITLTKAVMPSFRLMESTADGFRVHYSSPREGLETFVKGLLEGVAKTHFGETVSITYEAATEGTVFTLRRVVHELDLSFEDAPDVSADPLALLATG